MNLEPQETNAEVPDADLLEQATAVDPGDDEERPAPLSSASNPVNEADWIDQQRTVPLDDDRDNGGPNWNAAAH